MSIAKKVVLVGGGGHCIAVIDTIRRSNEYEIVGVVDPSPSLGLPQGIEILGDDSVLAGLACRYDEFLITIGQVKSATPRRKLAETLGHSNVHFSSVACPSAIVSSSAVIGPGTVILPNVVVGANVRIGSHCIVNSGAVIEHDSLVGNFCHVSTGAVVNGACVIGNGSFIGSNATVIQAIHIGEDCVIGAGSLVSRNIPAGTLAYGSPARAKRQ